MFQSTPLKGEVPNRNVYLAAPLDFSILGEHLGCCQHPHRRMFALHCMAETTRGFVAARFVTTLVALALLASLVGWLW